VFAFTATALGTGIDLCFYFFSKSLMVLHAFLFLSQPFLLFSSTWEIPHRTIGCFLTPRWSPNPFFSSLHRRPGLGHSLFFFLIPPVPRVVPHCIFLFLTPPRRRFFSHFSSTGFRHFCFFFLFFFCICCFFFFFFFFFFFICYFFFFFFVPFISEDGFPFLPPPLEDLFVKLSILRDHGLFFSKIDYILFLFEGKYCAPASLRVSVPYEGSHERATTMRRRNPDP